MLDARMIKSPDEIMLLSMAASMVDGVYQMISEVLKPGIRENEIVALVNKRLYEMGSDDVEGVNAISGERCSPHPHIFSDRLIRPGDQAFFDIIHSYNGYRTCYYRTFNVGRATQAQRDAYVKAREWMDAAITLVKPGVPTDEIVRVWPEAHEFGFADEMEAFGLQFGHALGQEAIAAGFAVAMRPDDFTFCTYRGHAHTLARGAPMAAAMAELLGRQDGLLAGKGGSMHLTSVEHFAMGSYAIVGAHLPIAAGAAWSAQYRGTKQVACAFFGDGATNIGAFHEALNLATVWKLPVIFVCENNLYMEYTPISAVTAVKNPAADRAASYGLERQVIDGNDADVVYSAARDAFAKARSGGGPSLIECLTYRHSGHSRADPAKYRPNEELEQWLKRDPVTLDRNRWLASG